MEAAARRKARHDRDDASPRLLERVPRLQTLHFEITVSRRGAALRAERHVKRFVVAQAPARFIVTCTDPECRDGGHDVTERVLRALAAVRERFEIEGLCAGSVDDGVCGRSVRITAHATYEGRRGAQ
jgi:hypothetical protein